MDPSNPHGSSSPSDETVWTELSCSACSEQLFGQIVVVTMTPDEVPQEAMELPHLMAKGEATDGELQISFPMHITHFEEFIQEIFRMERKIDFLVSVTDVGDVLSNVKIHDKEG